MIRICYLKAACILLLLIIPFVKPQAAEFNVPAGDVRALIDAILAANTNRDASNTINLARNSVYELTQPHAIDVTSFNIRHGSIGLPIFRDGKTLIINGNGAVIRRRIDSVPFRIISLDIYSKVTINNLSIENGFTTGAGGGIYKVTGGELTLNNVKFINNEARERGGGLYIGSRNNTIINNCEFLNNKCAIKGAGIYNVLADLEINNTKFSGNSGTSNEMEGGGLFVDGARSDDGRKGRISISKCVFSDNKANASSAGLQLFLYNNNEGFIDQCDISNNVLLGNGRNSSFGGGVYLSGGASGSNGVNNVIVKVTNTLIDNNTSVSQGGGLWLGRVRVEIENSTISNNKGNAGGIAAGSSSLSLKNCTIANNVSTTGTGGITSGGSVSASNCIFFNNVGTGGKHHFGSTGSLVDLGNNIQFKSGEADKYMPTTIRVANPLLLPLADNGGPTRTMALQKGSPAIDAGNNCTPTDQRGQRRIGQCDIGAFEYVPEVSTPTVPNAPINLKATSPLQGQIVLNWEDNATDETGFKIERSTTAGSGFVEIAQVTANITSYTDNNLTIAATYFYRVRAYNAAGNSAYSNEASVVVTALNQTDVSNLLNIYPNPTADRLSFKLDFKKQGNFQVRITDLTGRIMISEVWNKNTDVLHKDLLLDSLSSGVYLVYIYNEDYKAIKKLVKE